MADTRGLVSLLVRPAVSPPPGGYSEGTALSTARSRYGFRRVVALLLLALAILVLWRTGVFGSVFGSDGGSERDPRTSATGSPAPATSSPSPTPTLQTPPECTYGRVRAAKLEYSDWELTLLDTSFRLPRRYAPRDVVTIDNAGFQGSLLLRSFAIPDLAALREAAAEAGNPVDVVAAYRSYQQQADLFARRVNELGYERAARGTARAGHSEHQLGTSVDFKTLGQTDVDRRWASTPAGRWVQSNAHLFGFVQSYPRGKALTTCYGYEPWHYRYFGRKMAAEIHESGLTVREYLWNLQQGSIEP
jgi:D-alanyl-D-alanine carboxypeptidase